MKKNFDRQYREILKKPYHEVKKRALIVQKPAVIEQTNLQKVKNYTLNQNLDQFLNQKFSEEF